MSGLRASQNTEKLALIPRYRYINVDFGGVDWPPNRNLRTDNFSDSARENGANQEIKRIGGYFGGLARSARQSITPLLGATMLAVAPTAFAGDNSSATPAQPVSATIPMIEILPDAQNPADDWVADHSDRIAISVVLGTENGEQMKVDLPKAMNYQFAERGETGIRYFWEQSDTPGTGFAIHTNAYVAGPLTFGNPQEVIAEIEKVVRLKNGRSTDFASALETAYD